MGTSDNPTPISTLLEKAEDYSKTTLELVKLKVLDTSADVVSSLASRLIIYSVFMMFILTLSIGVAMWIGELVGKMYMGFLILGGFDVVIVLFLYAFRRQWITNPINNSIIKQVLK